MLMIIAKELRNMAQQVDDALKPIAFPDGDISNTEAKEMLKKRCKAPFRIVRDIFCSEDKDEITYSIVIYEMNYKSFEAGRLADAVNLALSGIQAANVKSVDMESADAADAKEQAK